MEINRAQRDRARKKTSMEYEAVNSTVSEQKTDPVHTHSENENTVSKSGVIVRARQMHGESAIQKAKDLLNNKNTNTLQRPKTERDCGEEWFRDNQRSVERLIKEPIRTSKNQRVSVMIKRKPKVVEPEIEPASFENYRPVIDDDAEEYVPLKDR